MINIRTTSTIATAIAAAGTVATGIFAAKGSLKLVRESDGESVTQKDIFKTYAPAGVAAAITIAAIGFLGYSNTDLGNRLIKEISAHAVTVAASQASIKALEEKAKELIGPKKTQTLVDTHTEAEQKFRTDAAGPAIQPAFIQDNTEAGNTLCYDRFGARYFYSSAEFIRACVNDINRDILEGQYITMDDIHDALGLQRTEHGHYFAVPVDASKVEAVFTSTVVGNDVMCLNVAFKGLQLKGNDWL